MESAAISFPIFGEDFVITAKNYIDLFGFKIYLYGLFIALGFILAGVYVIKRAPDFGLSFDNVLDIIIVSVPSGLIGARLYYIIFNPYDYFGAGKWLNIFKIREGGLAVYGGIIFAAIAVIIYGKVKIIPFGKLADACSMGLLIGQAVGRWGNFFNREAYGSETSLPWKMGLTQQGGNTYFVHPTFLYESLWNILGLILLHTFSKKRKKYDGQIFLLYVAWYGFGRFIIEGLRIDSLYLYNSDIRVSQLLAAISFCAAVYLLLRYHFRGVVLPVTEAGFNAVESDDSQIPEDENAELLSECEVDNHPAEEPAGQDNIE